MGRWDTISVDDSRMRCYLAEPREVNGPGVLVCMHGPGVDDFICDICDRLAASGFVTIAPDLYHRQREPHIEPWTKIRDTEASHDLAKAINALTDLYMANPQRVGIVGFCMGGRLAFLQAAHNSNLRAAVVFHGGNLMVAKDGLPSPFEQARNISAPVLGLFGAEDGNPSPSDVQKVASELTRLGKEHEFHIYEGAGHAFLNFTRPAVFREAQAKEAWARCLAWLHRYL